MSEYELMLVLELAVPFFLAFLYWCNRKTTKMSRLGLLLALVLLEYPLIPFLINPPGISTEAKQPNPPEMWWRIK